MFLGRSTVWLIPLIDMDNHGDSKKNRVVRIHDSLDELSTDLADYIAELSEQSVKERGFFAIALSGGSLIGLIGYVLVSSPVWHSLNLARVF